jgi:hypothetical protein
VNVTEKQLTATICDPVSQPGQIAAHLAFQARQSLRSSNWAYSVFMLHRSRIHTIKSFSDFFNRFSFPVS